MITLPQDPGDAGHAADAAPRRARSPRWSRGSAIAHASSGSASTRAARDIWRGSLPADAGFAAKHEDDIVCDTEGRIPERPPGFGGEEERLAERGHRGFELRPSRPYPNIDVLPVIQPGASHLALVERKPERLDQVQCRARGETGSPGIAGVPVDLRMNKCDVYSHACNINRGCRSRGTPRGDIPVTDRFRIGTFDQSRNRRSAGFRFQLYPALPRELGHVRPRRRSARD